MWKKTSDKIKWAIVIRLISAFKYLLFSLAMPYKSCFLRQKDQFGQCRHQSVRTFKQTMCWCLSHPNDCLKFHSVCWDIWTKPVHLILKLVTCTRSPAEPEQGPGDRTGKISLSEGSRALHSAWLKEKSVSYLLRMLVFIITGAVFSNLIM